MQGDIVAQGLELMLYGMGTVVIFLSVLVVATTVMSRLVVQFFPDPQPPAAPARQSVHGQDTAAVDPGVVAAISAAVHQHRRSRR